MKYPFAIGIPTLNRYDLLKESLDKYAVDFKDCEIHIVDNGNQGIDPPANTTVHVMSENIGVAASWNFLCREIFKKHSIAFILNDDVYWGKEQESVLRLSRYNISRSMNVNKTFVTSPDYWNVFRISKKCFSDVGPFDENFYPAYFEDNDFAYRLKLAGHIHSVNNYFRPEKSIRSGSLQKDKSINDKFMDNQNYYVRKWGGMPGKETFSTPFNK